MNQVQHFKPALVVSGLCFFKQYMHEELTCSGTNANLKAFGYLALVMDTLAAVSQQ